MCYLLNAGKKKTIADERVQRKQKERKERKRKKSERERLVTFIKKKENVFFFAEPRERYLESMCMCIRGEKEKVFMLGEENKWLIDLFSKRDERN